MGERLHGNEWFEIREQVLERDNWTCRNCSDESNLVVHHVVPISDRGTNRLQNLVTLCRECHRAAHGHQQNTTATGKTRSPTRRVFSTDELSDLCRTISHPLSMAVVATISKTGIGIGELCNVDMGDIDFASDSGITTPFAGPGIRVRYGGDIPYNNRRERSHETVVPIDTELEVLLRRWIAIRPDPDQTDALFLETKGNWGNRIQPSTVRYIFEKIGRENGCYSQNDQLENFTPVALRYFFEERFQGRPQHRDYILGRLDRSEIDLSTLENDYRASIFRLFSDGP